MNKIVINYDKAAALSAEQIEAAIEVCPFQAIEHINGKLEINAGCKVCKICTQKDFKEVFELVEVKKPEIDKSLWKGIAVFIDTTEGYLHPVSLELIGKAKELAQKINHPIYALCIGHNLSEVSSELLHYGVNNIYVYDHEKLSQFLIEPYTNAFEDFIVNIKPSSILVGATTVGRSLAPRVAARMRTGLTADCTKLDMKENTDLVQIRPAFGGNIMAQINTPNHRPQIATVRYKIFNAPEKSSETNGKIIHCSIPEEKLKSRIKSISITKKQLKPSISEADIIVTVGRGIKSQKDLDMAYELAEAINGQLAITRPLSEAGWVDPNRQIGLSGRTVKPKLIFTLGISGSVQFRAGMENSEVIISINTDENAAIFNASHYAVVGDIYEVVPKLVSKIQERVMAHV